MGFLSEILKVGFVEKYGQSVFLRAKMSLPISRFFSLSVDKVRISIISAFFAQRDQIFRFMPIIYIFFVSKCYSTKICLEFSGHFSFTPCAQIAVDA